MEGVRASQTKMMVLQMRGALEMGIEGGSMDGAKLDEEGKTWIFRLRNFVCFGRILKPGICTVSSDAVHKYVGRW